MSELLHGDQIYDFNVRKGNSSRIRLDVLDGPGPLRITWNFLTIALCSPQWTKLTISQRASGKEVDIQDDISEFKKSVLKNLI